MELQHYLLCRWRSGYFAVSQVPPRASVTLEDIGAELARRGADAPQITLRHVEGLGSVGTLFAWGYLSIDRRQAGYQHSVLLPGESRDLNYFERLFLNLYGPDPSRAVYITHNLLSTLEHWEGGAVVHRTLFDSAGEESSRKVPRVAALIDAVDQRWPEAQRNLVGVGWAEFLAFANRVTQPPSEPPSQQDSAPVASVAKPPAEDPIPVIAPLLSSPPPSARVTQLLLAPEATQAEAPVAKVTPPPPAPTGEHSADPEPGESPLTAVAEEAVNDPERTDPGLAERTDPGPVERVDIVPVEQADTDPVERTDPSFVFHETFELGTASLALKGIVELEDVPAEHTEEQDEVLFRSDVPDSNPQLAPPPAAPTQPRRRWPLLLMMALCMGAFGLAWAYWPGAGPVSPVGAEQLVPGPLAGEVSLPPVPALEPDVVSAPDAVTPPGEELLAPQEDELVAAPPPRCPLVDQDGDSFSIYADPNDPDCKSLPLKTPDCDDTNARIHPAAPVTCDGRDSDCDGNIECSRPNETPVNHSRWTQSTLRLSVNNAHCSLVRGQFAFWNSTNTNTVYLKPENGGASCLILHDTEGPRKGSLCNAMPNYNGVPTFNNENTKGNLSVQWTCCADMDECGTEGPRKEVAFSEGVEPDKAPADAAPSPDPAPGRGGRRNP